jgi:Tol biopolymer transport system component
MDQIWLMNADGSDERLLAALSDAHAEAPEWSPDGSMIAFVGSTYGIGGAESDSDAVYVVNVATGEITKVLSGIAVGIGHDSHATWLPNGDALLVMTKTP